MTLESDRVVSRLRSLTPARLARPNERGLVPQTLSHELSQRLADLAAERAGRQLRPVPSVPAESVADQLAVMICDLLNEGREADWEQAVGALIELRRSL